MIRVWQSIKKIDWIIFISVLFLLFLGLAIIYSTSGTNLLNFKKQAIFICLGLFLMFIVSLANYRALKTYTFLFYFSVLGLLKAVLIWGPKIRGVTSWLNWGAYTLQPTEIVKLVMIIVLAKYFAKHFRQMYQIRHIVISGLFTFLPVALILFQPDLGSIFVLVGIWLGMLVTAGIRQRHLIVLGLVGFLISLSSWLFFLREYQKARILAFLNPEIDPFGRAWQMIQSIIAVGSGGLWGKGLGHGSQTQLNFLPEQQTDFIFAALAEELGFIGVVLVVGLFSLLFFRILKISLQAPDNFGRMLSIGVCLMLLVHIIINIGMNIGLIPITGIPLPFLSYGGSSLLTNLIALGILQSIVIRSRMI